MSSKQQTFSQLWSALYAEALKVAEIGKASPTSSSDPKHKQKVVVVLEKVCNTVFGLGTENKAAIISHGDGTLELIVSLVSSTDALSDKKAATGDKQTGSEGQLDNKILVMAMKAVRTCVVRNPVGRLRSRSAGVFLLLKDTLVGFSDDVHLVEESMTTLAAVCLGDDLNTLQGSMQLRCLVDSAASTYPKSDSTTNLHQKISYLNALFDAVMKEYSEVVQFIGESQCFFDDVIAAEVEFRTANKFALEKDFVSAETHYCNAEERIPSELECTLLDSLRCQILWNRANVRFNIGKVEESLKDTATLLKASVPTEITVSLQKLRANALSKLGRCEEAKVAVGKALIVNPRDEDLQMKMKDLTTTET
mmetsp:Transcript_39079/g.79685  ORF Transcript_39079/g.79685 Transcript_39079/m.79685 type:complete len:365 (-) Transcript_39079:130-1224(-)|eukprot:CAMPEP_0183294594 /NCGR_PEP_ID=MMETSP0160_2-20130417/2873_1 /TAXON_ID=2839 ORGANISM="Odontella Sinensis, Strain Grunow 1884" /NCGR_SAMPLE_ID=MMETSP0160_2 /ASSEMBLY_ACC=CAM_ASM_000250 /LENGTH=364 /DNA_ID=CAMNT_0025455943 /DNA_START=67 /DNA_END=1161 /DNA_ORIENTATION=+